jgi:stalled ribosome rescue protein Dom34
MMPADDSREREYSGHLANYYDEVISCLRPAKAILLFGPGEAKGELRKRIERNKLDVRITSCETSDKMTERQISEKVRRHYLPSGATLPPRQKKQAVTTG